jgi:hypothetical protein
MIFFSLFDIAFPLPKQQTWQLAMVPIRLKSNVFEMLHGKQMELQQWTAPNATATGVRGQRTVTSIHKMTVALASLPTTLRT